MKMTRLRERAVILGLLLLGVGLPSLAADTDVERGKGLYEEYGCYACHGYGGAGRTPLAKETSGILASEALFTRYLRLRADQNPINPKNTMPNYSVDTLSDDAASTIYAYLVSLDDTPPEIDDIPAFVELLEHAKEDPELEDESN